MRIPSIHIKEDDFKAILKSFDINIKNVDDITNACKKHSCINRSMVATNQKQRNTISKLLQSDKSDANLVAKIIVALRVRKGHNGVRQIKENGREWPQIKELANTCNQFCEALQLEKREGFIKYIEMGLTKIKSYYGYIGKLISMYDSLVQEVESVSELQSEDPAKGLNMHDAYVSMIASKTGISETYVGNPSKMLCFQKAAKQCDEIGCDYDTWIEAQFEALSFCNGIPMPEQLYGDKGRERLSKYLYKYNIQIENKSKPVNKKSIDWDNILGS